MGTKRDLQDLGSGNRVDGDTIDVDRRHWLRNGLELGELSISSLLDTLC